MTASCSMFVLENAIDSASRMVFSAVPWCHLQASHCWSSLWNDGRSCEERVLVGWFYVRWFWDDWIWLFSRWFSKDSLGATFAAPSSFWLLSGQRSIVWKLSLSHEVLYASFPGSNGESSCGTTRSDMFWNLNSIFLRGVNQALLPTAVDVFFKTIEVPLEIHQKVEIRCARCESLWGIGIFPCSPSNQLHGCLKYSTVPLRRLKFSSTKEGLVKNLGFEGGTTGDLKHHHLKYLISTRSILMTWLKIWVPKVLQIYTSCVFQIVHFRGSMILRCFEHFEPYPR